MNTETNNHAAAMMAIKSTPVGEAGQYLATAFFRDSRNQITIIQDGQTQTLSNDAGAAELVWLNLTDIREEAAHVLEHVRRFRPACNDPDVFDAELTRILAKYEPRLAERIAAEIHTRLARAGGIV